MNDIIPYAMTGFKCPEVPTYENNIISGAWRNSRLLSTLTYDSYFALLQLADQALVLCLHLI